MVSPRTNCRAGPEDLGILEVIKLLTKSHSPTMVSTPTNWRAGPGSPGILEVIKLLAKSHSPTMVSTPTNWRAGPGDPGNTPVTVIFTSLARVGASASRRVAALQI